MYCFYRNYVKKEFHRKVHRIKITHTQRIRHRKGHMKQSWATCGYVKETFSWNTIKERSIIQHKNSSVPMSS